MCAQDRKINADVVQSVFENNKTLTGCHLSSDAVLFGVCTLVSSVIQSCRIESNHLEWRAFGFRGTRCCQSSAQLELEKIGSSRFRRTQNAANGSALQRTREESHLANLAFRNQHPFITHLGTTNLANVSTEWQLPFAVGKILECYFECSSTANIACSCC